MTAWKLTDDESLRDLAIAEASEIFLETRKPFLSPRTVKDYQYCRKWLADYFGAKTLREITALDVQRFQAERAQRDGPSHINHMTSLLQQILKRAGLWEQVGRGFEPLPLLKNSPGRCITDDEEKAILRAALLHKRWEHLYFFILLSLHTTMGPGEAMGIRLKDIDLEKKQVSVRDAKNRFRVREIPLNDVALGVCRELLLWPR